MLRCHEIDLTLVSFEDASPYAPRAHIWVEDKLPWVHIDDGLPQYAQVIDGNAQQHAQGDSEEPRS